MANGTDALQLISRNRGSALVAMLLSAALEAAAQPPVVVEQPAVTQAPLVVPSISVDNTASPDPGGGPSIWRPRADRFTWAASVSGPASGNAMSSAITGNGHAWRATAGVSYSSGGFTVGLGMHGHHGYQLPSTMSFALGETSALDFQPPEFVDATGSRVWEARLMIKRRLSGRHGDTTTDAVAEALLPFAGDPARAGVPGNFMPIRSRALRFGIVVSY